MLRACRAEVLLRGGEVERRIPVPPAAGSLSGVWVALVNQALGPIVRRPLQLTVALLHPVNSVVFYVVDVLANRAAQRNALPNSQLDLECCRL